MHQIGSQRNSDERKKHILAEILMKCLFSRNRRIRTEPRVLREPFSGKMAWPSVTVLCYRATKRTVIIVVSIGIFVFGPGTLHRVLRNTRQPSTFLRDQIWSLAAIE